MGKKNNSPPADSILPAAQVPMAGFAAAALGAALFVGGAWGWEQAPFPYVWRDVALVHFLSALPAALWLALLVRRRASALGRVGLAAVLLAASVLFLLNAEPVSSPLSAAFVRAAPALGVALAAVLLGLGAISRSGSRRTAGRARGKTEAPAGSATTAALALVVLLLPPALYVRARCRDDAARLTGLLEQSRFGEARALARALLALDPAARWEGRPLRRAAADIERTTRALEARVARPLPAQATDARRLARARDLAMLGRSGAALDVLQSVSDASTFAEACNLRGTIHETRGAWEAGRKAYRAAQRAWRTTPASSRRTAGLVRAITGIAYCERKLGRYREAEAAYRELLALAPTADSHFLLARFYEDAQQTDKAQTHARVAMALAPDRYERAGQKLLDKLATLHFGCWGVFRSESK